MKVTVIHGTQHHGSTWHTTDLVLNALKRRAEVEVSEFLLPRDMPEFCRGCFTCFLQGEDRCPHARYITPIVEAIAHSDVVALTSPVYALDVSGQMKALLDHLCFQWVSHRPNAALFHTVGLAVATTAGMGLRHTARTLSSTLRYWGCPKVFRLTATVSAMRWEEVPEAKRRKLEKRADRLAAQIARLTATPSKMPKPLFRSILFSMMAGMQQKNNWCPTDRAHWERQGWLAGKRPF